MAGTKLYKKRFSVKTLYFYGVYSNEADAKANSLQLKLISLSKLQIIKCPIKSKIRNLELFLLAP